MVLMLHSLQSLISHSSEKEPQPKAPSNLFASVVLWHYQACRLSELLVPLAQLIVAFLFPIVDLYLVRYLTHYVHGFCAKRASYLYYHFHLETERRLAELSE